MGPPSPRGSPEFKPLIEGQPAELLWRVSSAAFRSPSARGSRYSFSSLTLSSLSSSFISLCIYLFIYLSIYLFIQLCGPFVSLPFSPRRSETALAWRPDWVSQAPQRALFSPRLVVPGTYVWPGRTPLRRRGGRLACSLPVFNGQPVGFPFLFSFLLSDILVFRSFRIFFGGLLVLGARCSVLGVISPFSLLLACQAHLARFSPAKTVVRKAHGDRKPSDHDRAE